MKSLAHIIHKGMKRIRHVLGSLTPQTVVMTAHKNPCVCIEKTGSVQKID